MTIVRGAILSLLLTTLALNAADTPGATRIAKWKNDKKAAFMLMYDDSMSTHVKNVIPDLKSRGLTATFYVNPGSGHWKLMKNAWEKEIPAASFEYGNHTFTHGGILDMAHGEDEIGRCNDAINAAFPDRKKKRLVSFGTPGVPKEKWKISPEDIKTLLAKHNLVLRPNVGGRFAQINLKTAEEMLGIVDKVLASGEKDVVCFHGVGGEWLSIAMPAYMQFINGLVERIENLWISDHIYIHKYETERTSAEVKVVEASDKHIRLSLSSKADPELFDAPLTLVTQVPAAWTKVEVTQGPAKSIVAVAKGAAMFDALPGADEIKLSPAN